VIKQTRSRPSNNGHSQTRDLLPQVSCYLSLRTLPFCHHMRGLLQPRLVENTNVITRWRISVNNPPRTSWSPRLSPIPSHFIDSVRLVRSGTLINESYASYCYEKTSFQSTKVPTKSQDNMMSLHKMTKSDATIRFSKPTVHVLA
jgi:hypothetical protein